MKACKIVGITGNYELKRSHIKTLISGYDKFTAREKNYLYKLFMSLEKDTVTADQINDLIKSVNLVDRTATARLKKKVLRDTMKDNRLQKLPVIFYLCSYHEKPGLDHKDYQGKLYVDKYWRAGFKAAPELWWLVDPIEDYISSHEVLSVQKVTTGKPYLITRPYCKHKLIPVNTWDVLTSSLSYIKSEHPEAVMGTGSKFRRQYYKERKKLVHNLLRMASNP